MGHNFQQRSSKLPDATAVVEKKHGSTRCRETHTSKYALDQPNLKNQRSSKHAFSQKSSSGSSHGKLSSKETKVTEDELVMHMSNLPSYLQRENLKDKNALNFGVLDWDRLENWKQNKNCNQQKNNRDPSLSRVSYTSTVSASIKNDKVIQDPDTDKVNTLDMIKNSQRMLMATQRNLDKKSSSGSNKGSKDRNMRFNTAEKGLPHDRAKSNNDQKHDSGGHKSIVLLLPKNSTKHSSELKVVTPKHYANTFISEEVFPKKQNSKFRQSPLVSRSSKLDGRNNTASTRQKIVPDQMTKTPKEDFRYETAHSCPLSEPSKSEFKEESTPRPDPVSAKRSHASPNRLFTLSLGKLSRSLSYKESTSRNLSEVSKSVDHNVGKSKSNCHTRAKSSPLRRLLDPLLKHADQSSKNTQPLEGGTSNSKEIALETLKAFLHVTSRNGAPLFKLVVENNSDIIVAMKRFPTPMKDDSCFIYSFYSVHEIKKKKSGIWLNQRNKERHFGFGYNTIGHMKISRSEEETTVTESVLYSVDPSLLEEETPELTPNRELAAVITKEDELIENEVFNKKTTVVVSAGAHSLPNKGVLLPLVDRWKMGGNCDCGGWDVGCQLRILTSKNEDKSTKVYVPSATTSSNPDHLDLFLQGDACEAKPIFSLSKSNKGVYLVEFRNTISLLQALFISIAAMGGGGKGSIDVKAKASEAFELEEEGLAKPRWIPPAKYVSSPPPSPVGRV